MSDPPLPRGEEDERLSEEERRRRREKFGWAPEDVTITDPESGRVRRGDSPPVPPPEEKS